MSTFNISRLISFIGGMVFILMVIAAVSVILVNRWIETPLNISSNTVITVKKGDTLGKLAYQLESNDILSSAQLLILYARFTKQTKIKVGEYLLTAGSNHEALLALLQSGEVIRYRVTLIEGKTFDDFIVALQDNKKLQHVLTKDGSHTELLQTLAIDIAHPEGWFFPDTYQFFSGMSDVNSSGLGGATQADCDNAATQTFCYEQCIGAGTNEFACYWRAYKHTAFLAQIVD